MGTSYDGVFFYGIVFDQWGPNEEDQGWPEATRQVVEDEDGDFILSNWLSNFLEMPALASYPSNGTTEQMNAWHQERDAWVAERQRRCLARFGVTNFEDGYMGWVDYPVNYIYPTGAGVSQWRGGQVPAWNLDSIATWKVACEKLREVLPGASPPGIYFGCSVG